MFNNLPFAMPQAPTDYQKIQQQMQYNQYNQYNNIQQIDKFADIQKTIQSLSNEERSALMQDETFVAINNQYETSLINYITSQYRQQYNNSPDGQKYLTALENALNERVGIIKSDIENERAQLKEVADLIKNNPELLKQLKK